MPWSNRCFCSLIWDDDYFKSWRIISGRSHKFLFFLEYPEHFRWIQDWWILKFVGIPGTSTHSPLSLVDLQPPTIQLWQDCIPRANFDTFLWSLALALVCPRGWPRTRGDLLDHRSCWISTIGPWHTLAPIINPNFSLWNPNFGDWSVGLTHFQPPFHCDDGLEGFDCTIRHLQKDYREPRLQTNTVLTELSKTYIVEWGGPWDR